MTESKSYREVEVEQKNRDEKYRVKSDVKNAIRECGLALDLGTQESYWRVARICQDLLIPVLLPDGDMDVRDYHDKLNDEDGWDWVSLDSFLESPDYWTQSVMEPMTSNSSQRILQGSYGRTPAETEAIDIIKSTYESLECIAEYEGYVSGDLTQSSDATGYAVKMGEHLSGYDFDLGDPVQIISKDSGLTKTLFVGGTGQGKSTAADMDVWDRYKNGSKIIDILDIKQGENFLYDVNNQSEALKRVREEMGLPAGFGDDAPPEIEILVPMTPGLEEKDLPYNTETENFVVRPVVVPASDIEKSLLISLSLSLLTSQQEASIRAAYAKVNRDKTDWTLKDLAEGIKSDPEMGDSEVSGRAVSVLSQLQYEGFIRDKKSDHTIDWERIFRNDRTITVFSTQYMDDLASKLMFIGYVMHSIIREREGIRGVQPAVVVARELWKIAPHNQREAFDTRAASLQSAIGGLLSEIMREGRHDGIELIADTQSVGDLVKSVRELFNRFVVFQTSKSQMKDIFEWTTNDKYQQAYSTLTEKTGISCVVGKTEPTVKKDNIEFVSPIKWSPPPFHHFDVDVDDEGGSARAKYLENEELRKPIEEGVDWAFETEVPDEYMIDSDEEINMSPLEEFAIACFEWTEDRGTWTLVEDVRDAYRQYEKEKEDAPPLKSKQSFGMRFKDALITAHNLDMGPSDIDNHPKPEGQGYVQLRMKRKGEKLRDKQRGIEPEE